MIALFGASAELREVVGLPCQALVGGSAARSDSLQGLERELVGCLAILRNPALIQFLRPLEEWAEPAVDQALVVLRARGTALLRSEVAECTALVERLMVAADELEFRGQVVEAWWPRDQGVREVLAVV